MRLISLERGSFPSGACQYYYSAIISFFPGIFLQSVLVHYWVLFSTNSQLFSPDFLSFSLLYLSFPSFVPSCIFVLFLFSLCSPFSLSVLNYPSPFQFYPSFPLCERGIPIFIPKFSSCGTLMNGFPLGLIFLQIWDTLFLLSILFFSLGLGSSRASSHFSFSQLNAHNLSVCLMHLYLFVFCGFSFLFHENASHASFCKIPF